jgi:hypothetical protein
VTAKRGPAPEAAPLKGRSRARQAHMPPVAYPGSFHVLALMNSSFSSGRVRNAKDAKRSAGVPVVCRLGHLSELSEILR